MTANPLANSWRGEVALELDGASHVLRPSFAALVAAEEELGPLFGLIERAGEGGLRLAELVGLFWHCLADRTGLTREAFGDAVIRAGLARATEPLRALFTQVLKGGG